MPRIGDAVNGEDNSSDGTEKIPVTGSKYMLVSTIAAYIRTLTQTLTNKTIDLASNTLTGTKAQFNTAMSDADFATLTGTETLTNKTLTAPTIADFTNMAHDHGDADDGGTALASPTITTPTISGAIVFPDNVTQTFNPGADNAGINVGSIAGDPATPDNGDIWYDSTAGELTARIGGANVAIGVAGSAAVATDTIWDAKGDLAVGTGANTAARLAVGTNDYVLTADSAESTGVKWAAASGGGRTLIAEVTPSGTGTVTVASSIVGTYKKLTLEFVVRSTNVSTNVSMDLILNSDTTDANYRRTIHYGYENSLTGAVGGANNAIGDIVTAASSPANSFSYGVLEFLQYANTNFNKHVLGHGSHRRDDTTVYELAWNFGMEWENTAAITQIDLTLASGNFVAGSVARLYGES